MKENKRSLNGCFFTFNAPFLSSIFATESESMVLEKAGHGVLCWYLVSLLNKSWPHSLQTYLPGNKSFIYIISEFRWTLILSIYLYHFRSLSTTNWLFTHLIQSDLCRPLLYWTNKMTFWLCIYDPSQL